MINYDVIGVDLITNEVRIIAEKKSERNANAIIEMAVIRNGCEEEFFTIAQQGKYKEGDIFFNQKAKE